MSRQESGDDSRVIKMRNRAQLTCEACKKSKIKCDRGQPVCDQVSHMSCVGVQKAEAISSDAYTWKVSQALKAVDMLLP